MKNFLLIFLFILAGCKRNSDVKSISPKQKSSVSISTDSITEIYDDSLNIGIKGKNRIILKRISGKDSVYADIDFYTLQNGKWSKKQHFALAKDGITGLFPEFTDFNNDGYNDFTYKSSIAARGANDIRNLLIFNPESGKLTLIKNSKNFPNLRYNPKLDCIDAFAVYGGSTSYFLKIEGDTLRKFAWIDIFDGIREVYKTDGTKKETLIKRDTFQTLYLRYKNYDPLEEYSSEEY